jgi:hypothetical protein
LGPGIQKVLIYFKTIKNSSPHREWRWFTMAKKPEKKAEPKKKK